MAKKTKQTTDAPKQQLPRKARWALASLSLSMLMPSLDTSIANAGLPALAKAFNGSFQEVQWIVLAYLLTITALIVSVGRLGDVIGHRKLLLIGISVFTAASVLCGLAPTLWLLVAARAAQGLGAAVMMALTVALVSGTIPEARTGSAMGVLGTMSAIGTTVGPSLGGILIAAFGWRSIFLVNLPLGILNLILAHRFLSQETRKAASRRERFDLTGTALLSVTLVAYALAMTTGRGHFGYLNLTMLIAVVAGGALFVFSQTRNSAPLLRMSLLKDTRLSSALTMSALVSTVMMTTLVVGPFYLVRGLGMKAAFVGLALSVGPLFAALTGAPAGRLVDRLGTFRTTIPALTGMAVGCSVLAILPAKYGVAGYILPVMIMTSSYALFQTANNTSIMKNIGPEQRGVIAGMLSLSRNLGLITGASVMGAIFSIAAATGDFSTAEPAVVAAGMHITFAVAAALMAGALIIAVANRPRPWQRTSTSARQAAVLAPEG